MTEDIKGNIVSMLETLKSDIQKRMEIEGINASGITSASFHVEAYDGGVKLVAGGEGAAPIETLEIGRPGGNVPAGFRFILYAWSIDKGISFSSDSERMSFAYLLGKKIQREGTLRNANHVDVYSSLVKEASGKIESKIATALKESIKLNF